MSKYVCVSATYETVAKGNNAGQQYVSASFLPEGCDSRSGRRARKLNFFASTGTEAMFLAAWKPTIDAVLAGQDISKLTPGHPAYFSINAQEIAVPMPAHAKTYRQDTVHVYKDANGNTQTVTYKAGQAIRKPNSQYVNRFDTVTVFLEVDSDGKPFVDPVVTAKRLFDLGCITWDKIPKEAQDPADVAKEPEAKGDSAVPEPTAAPVI